MDFVYPTVNKARTIDWLVAPHTHVRMGARLPVSDAGMNSCLEADECVLEDGAM